MKSPANAPRVAAAKTTTTKSRRRRDDDSETLKKRDTNRRVTGKVVDAVKAREQARGREPAEAFARTDSEKALRDMDVNGDGVLSREIRDARWTSAGAIKKMPF